MADENTKKKGQPTPSGPPAFNGSSSTVTPTLGLASSDRADRRKRRDERRHVAKERRVYESATTLLLDSPMADWDDEPEEYVVEFEE